jgi:hypothetical protein
MDAAPRRRSSSRATDHTQRASTRHVEPGHRSAAPQASRVCGIQRWRHEYVELALSADVRMAPDQRNAVSADECVRHAE